MAVTPEQQELVDELLDRIEKDFCVWCQGEDEDPEAIARILVAQLTAERLVKALVAHQASRKSWDPRWGMAFYGNFGGLAKGKPVVEVTDVACQSCGAAPGDACVTPKGKQPTKPHQARRRFFDLEMRRATAEEAGKRAVAEYEQGKVDLPLICIGCGRVCADQDTLESHEEECLGP